MIKVNFQRMITLGLAPLVSYLIVSCSAGSTNYLGTDGETTSSSELASFAPKANNFRMSLTDAPNEELKSVFVNVLRAELWLKNGAKEARLVVAQDLGLVDLLTLRNGVLLPMADLVIPAGVSITQIRLILGPDNYAIKNVGGQCSLQTPSGQQSGIKIKLANEVTIETGKSYSLVLDFDAAKSIVVKGNGDCLLKPVLKIGAFVRLDEEDINNDGTTDNSGEDVIDDSSSIPDNSSDESGYDESDVTTMPPEIVDPDVIFNL